MANKIRVRLRGYDMSSLIKQTKSIVGLCEEDWC